MRASTPARRDIEPPVGLLAEVTHRCPLHCVYCSNPLEMARKESELPTEDWLRVLDEAADLGVLQVHFSGGEPLLRPDILDLLERASERQLFTNLITSGIGLTQKVLDGLVELDLGSFQLSFQGSDPTMVELVADGPFWDKKLEIGHRVKETGLSLSINTVLHRLNLHQVGDLIELAAELEADRIELANTQYYGWALKNRDRLLPSKEQVQDAAAVVEEKRERYGDQMEIIWVIPDYHADFPKPCMGGWGDSLMSIEPTGLVMPCLAANLIPDLDLPSVRDHSLSSIWYESSAFNAFRGDAWMKEPCASCPMRVQDHGGCRCQAYLLAGDARATDPVCIYAPEHDVIERAHQDAAAEERAAAKRPAGEGAEEQQPVEDAETPLVHRRM